MTRSLSYEEQVRGLAGRLDAARAKSPRVNMLEAYSFHPAEFERTTANSGGTGPRAQARLPQSDN